MHLVTNGVHFYPQKSSSFLVIHKLKRVKVVVRNNFVLTLHFR